eukprot:TRINITY_DN14959_c1_g1_i1.p1 TRINITY_DN14959_c1_g1~~TRINITY_DN14959_c1_g1_i1.p1  ORF type:complete len:1142 (+),score=278.26 TRINITY_DN14959_c1_g1_i1:77-3502(+)
MDETVDGTKALSKRLDAKAEHVDAKDSHLSRSQWDLIKNYVSNCIREIQKIWKEFEALKEKSNRSISDVERVNAANLKLEEDIVKLQLDIDDERTQRISGDAAAARSVMEMVKEQVNAELSTSETKRQRFEIQFAGYKRDVHDKHEALMERVVSVEDTISESLPSAIADLRQAKTRFQANLKEQMEHMKALHESHRTALAESLDLEKNVREEALSSFQAHFMKRMTEERTSREKRDAYIQEAFIARLEEEKAERDSSHHTLGELVSSDRTRREKQMAAFQGSVEAALNDEQGQREVGDAELRAALSRERQARESQRSLMQEALEDERAARESQAKDLLSSIESTRSLLVEVQQSAYFKEGLAAERLERETQIASLRETVTGLEQHQILAYRPPTEDSAALCKQLEEVLSERLGSLEQWLQDELTREVGNREADLASLREEYKKDRVSQEHLAAFEHKLRGEASARDADIQELRRLLGGDQLREETHRNGVEDVSEDGGIRCIGTSVYTRLQQLEEAVNDTGGASPLGSLRERVDWLEQNIRGSMNQTNGASIQEELLRRDLLAKLEAHSSSAVERFETIEKSIHSSAGQHATLRDGHQLLRELHSTHVEALQELQDDVATLKRSLAEVARTKEINSAAEARFGTLDKSMQEATDHHVALSGAHERIITTMKELQDGVISIEKRLEEEASTRESGMSELQDIVGDVQLKIDDIEEKIGDFVKQDLDDCLARVADVSQKLEADRSTYEVKFISVQETSTKLQTVVHALSSRKEDNSETRVDQVELLETVQEKIDTFERKLQKDITREASTRETSVRKLEESLDEQHRVHDGHAKLVSSLQDRMDMQGRKLEEWVSAELGELRDSIGKEELSQESHYNSLKELLDKERGVHAAQMKLIQTEVTSRAERLEDIDILLNKVVERQATNEAAQERLSIRLSADIESAIARERAAREESRKMLLDVTGEQYDRERIARERCESSMRESVELLTRNIGTERSQRNNEDEKIWNALEAHTHETTYAETVITTTPWLQAGNFGRPNKKAKANIGPLATTPTYTAGSTRQAPWTVTQASAPVTTVSTVTQRLACQPATIQQQQKQQQQQQEQPPASPATPCVNDDRKAADSPAVAADKLPTSNDVEDSKNSL